jgi:quercetin dioxygenase-like cupin family protein
MPEHTDLKDLEATAHAEVFETRKPRTVRLLLEAEESVPPHTHPGTDVVFLCLSGQIELSVDDEVFHVNSEEAVRFRGEQEVSPKAIEDSTAIIVIAPAEDEESGV